ncbi:hypothetical protein GDO78_003587 [Eleutherodactylus coqui]|uniref:Uncharacterized protein n=1 Tax=Eleutherodactylus coqui TaxID=57060 RepID=A0A8J6K0P7_ELECQ|nr:hypothetical protein GDO78_003587 [Eleutherodactylus coqui]
MWLRHARSPLKVQPLHLYLTLERFGQRKKYEFLAIISSLATSISSLQQVLCSCNTFVSERAEHLDFGISDCTGIIMLTLYLLQLFFLMFNRRSVWTTPAAIRLSFEVLVRRMFIVSNKGIYFSFLFNKEND